MVYTSITGNILSGSRDEDLSSQLLENLRKENPTCSPARPQSQFKTGVGHLVSSKSKKKVGVQIQWQSAFLACVKLGWGQTETETEIAGETQIIELVFAIF